MWQPSVAPAASSGAPRLPSVAPLCLLSPWHHQPTALLHPSDLARHSRPHFPWHARRPASEEIARETAFPPANPAICRWTLTSPPSRNAWPHCTCKATVRTQSRSGLGGGTTASGGSGGAAAGGRGDRPPVGLSGPRFAGARRSTGTRRSGSDVREAGKHASAWHRPLPRGPRRGRLATLAARPAAGHDTASLGFAVATGEFPVQAAQRCSVRTIS